MMMSRPNLRTMALALACTFAGAGAMYSFQAKAEPPKSSDKDKDKDKTKKGEMPDAVKSAADKFFGTTYTHKTAIVDGMTQYQCKGEKNGHETEAVFTESGDLVNVRKFMKPGELPAAVLANFRDDHKDAKVTKVAEVESHYYAITYDEKGSEQRVKTYPNGRVWKHSDLDSND